MGLQNAQKQPTRSVPTIPKFTRSGAAKITLIFSGAFLIGQYVGHKGANYMEHYYDFRGSSDDDD